MVWWLSKTRQNRMKRYTDLTFDKKAQRVYSREGDEFGFNIGEAPPYTGEAGYSSRIRVLWSNGKTTLCCLKGMKTYRKKHYKIL